MYITIAIIKINKNQINCTQIHTNVNQKQEDKLIMSYYNHLDNNINQNIVNIKKDQFLTNI